VDGSPPYTGSSAPAGGTSLFPRPFQRPVAVVGFTVAAGRVVELDLITDPGRLDGVAGSLVDA
jgi:hypothetical protein